MNDLKPLPDCTVNDTINDVSSIDNEDNQETIEEDDILVLYEDWIDELDQKDIQLIAKMIYFVE